jgi:hypothetical protein
VSTRICKVSFKDARGIRHAAEVEADSLFEAVILAVRLLKASPWVDVVGPSTLFDVEVREPSTSHSITMQQVQRWLDGASPSPNESVRKAKLKNVLLAR